MSDRTSPWFEDLEAQFLLAKVRYQRLIAYSSGELVRVYVFPANDTPVRGFADRFNQWVPNYELAFQYSWAADWDDNNTVIFDACSIQARYQFASVTGWPVFMVIKRIIRSDTFQFSVIPIVLEDLAGQKFQMNLKDSSRWLPLDQVVKRFKPDILHPSIETLRSSYDGFPAEAHKTSVLYTLAWQNVLRTLHPERFERAESPNGNNASNLALAAFRDIQRLRAENSKPRNVLGPVRPFATPAVSSNITQAGVTASLSAHVQTGVPLAGRCQIHYSVVLTDDLLQPATLQQMLVAVSDVKAAAKNPTKTTKRRKVLLEETNDQQGHHDLEPRAGDGG
jgi:hypothetical protein